MVFYLGCGAGGSRVPQTGFTLGDLVAGGAVLGYGTPAGGPIPRGFVDGNLDLHGRPADRQLTNTIDEDTLRAAGELGVTYYHRDKGQAITPVIPAVTPTPQPTPTRCRPPAPSSAPNCIGCSALSPAALVFAEIYLTIRDYRHTRSADGREAMMLRADPHCWPGAPGTPAVWWSGGPTRLRLRRRLVVFSIPVGADPAGPDRQADLGAARRRMPPTTSPATTPTRCATTSTPWRAQHHRAAKVTFAHGGLAVLEGRLEDAEHSFSAAVARTSRR